MSTYSLEQLPSGNVALMRGVENIAHVCSIEVGRQIIDALTEIEAADRRNKADERLLIRIAHERDAAEQRCKEWEEHAEAVWKILCTCGYAGRPGLRDGLSAARTILAFHLGKEVPQHLKDVADRVVAEISDGWPEGSNTRV